MANRSHLAAPRYELPDGYVDAVAYDETLIKGKPKVLDVAVASRETVTKADLAVRLQARTGFNKTQANAAVNVVFEEMSRALESGSDVAVRGFGSFRSLTSEEAASLLRRLGTMKRRRVLTRRKGKAKSGPGLGVHHIDFKPSAGLLDQHLHDDD